MVVGLGVGDGASYFPHNQEVKERKKRKGPNVPFMGMRHALTPSSP